VLQRYLASLIVLYIPIWPFEYGATPKHLRFNVILPVALVSGLPCSVVKLLASSSDPAAIASVIFGTLA